MKRSFHPRSSACARRLRPARSGQAGFTLIEVLVAMIVLVLGVLGAAAMTLNAIRDGKQSGLRSQASALAYEIGDLMRANPPLYPRAPASNVPYVDTEAVFTAAPGGPTSACWTTGCSPLDMARNDYYEWSQKLTGPNGLPNGAAVICRDATKLDQYPACDGAATSPLVVKLKWDEKNNNARDASAPQAVTTRYLVVTLQPF